MWSFHYPFIIRYLVQNLNDFLRGSHETEPVINEISPVRDVIVMLNLPQKPSSLRLEPSGRSLEFEWNDGIATVVIPSIPIYEILLVN